MRKLLLLVKSKTVWAGVIGAASVIVNADAINPDVFLQAVSILLGAVGLKDAIHKSGPNAS